VTEVVLMSSIPWKSRHVLGRRQPQAGEATQTHGRTLDLCDLWSAPQGKRRGPRDARAVAADPPIGRCPTRRTTRRLRRAYGEQLAICVSLRKLGNLDDAVDVFMVSRDVSRTECDHARAIVREFSPKNADRSGGLLLHGTG